MAHTFNLLATPVTHVQHDGWASTSFLMFRHPQVVDTITVDKPSDIAEALAFWAMNTPLPPVTDWDGNEVQVNAWSVSLRKPTRWPAGFKQAGERHHTFVQHTIDA